MVPRGAGPIFAFSAPEVQKATGSNTDKRKYSDYPDCLQPSHGHPAIISALYVFLNQAVVLEQYQGTHLKMTLKNKNRCAVVDISECCLQKAMDFLCLHLQFYENHAILIKTKAGNRTVIFLREKY